MDRGEVVWILSVVILLGVFAGSIVYALGVRGFSVASEAKVLPPEKAPGVFQPGVKDLGGGRYEVNIVAYQWGFRPSRIELRDPVEVVFRIYSTDVIHGFQVVGTNVNAMVIPGYVGVIVWKPPANLRGSFLVLCNEYCGIGHSGMYAELVILRG